MFILDTNVLSGLRRNPADPSVVEWIGTQDEAVLYTTSVNIYEIKRGILSVPPQDTHQLQVLNRWLDRILERFSRRILSFDADAAIAAAEANQRTSIDLRGCMIGAIANRNGMTVVTRNVTHLERVADRVINPWDRRDGNA